MDESKDTKELKPANEVMSRRYALQLLGMLADIQRGNRTEEQETHDLASYLRDSMEQIEQEGYDYDDLVSYKMPEEYEQLITVTHKQGTWEERVSKGIEEMQNIAKSYLDDDFYKMSSKELKDIGFMVWDGDLHLIPLYLLRVFGDNDPVESINGNRGTIRDVDLDTRLGCIAYGIRAKAIIT